MTTTTTHPCPDCGAVFARPTPHCEDCGRHGAHECWPGDAARKARARAFLQGGIPKGYSRWSDKRYDYKETT